MVKFKVVPLLAVSVALALCLSATTFAQPHDPTSGPQSPVITPRQIAPLRNILPTQTIPTTTRRAPQLHYAPSPQGPQRSVPVVMIWHDGQGAMPRGTRDAAIDQRFPERDHDQDGVIAFAYGGADCDDNDNRRAPGHTEVSDQEGIDEDCDPATVGARDLDGDGFLSWKAQNIFHDAQGQVVAIIRGADCDDSNPEVNPGSPEVLGNLRDDNCDGLIDVLDMLGHNDYCAPTTHTVYAPYDPCGRPQGDTSQFTPAP